MIAGGYEQLDPYEVQDHELVGLDWTVPDFSTLCRRQRTLNVSIPYRGGAGPLNLLIPSRDITA